MNENRLTWPVFSLLMSRRGVERGALGEGGSVVRTHLGSPRPQQPPTVPTTTYLLMRDAKGCTCREVPMMTRRSAFRKSCEGEWPVRAEGPVPRLGFPTLPPIAPTAGWGSHLPQGRAQAAPTRVEHGVLAGTLTDCMQEKNRAGRFSPKNTMSEAEIGGQTQRQRDGGTGEADTGMGRERTVRKRRLVGGGSHGAPGTAVAADPPSLPGTNLGQGQRVARGRVNGKGSLLEKGSVVGVPGPKAHQASPHSDISHTWESPRRRSSLAGRRGGQRRG